MEKKGNYFFEFINIDTGSIEKYNISFCSYLYNETIAEIDLNEINYYGYLINSKNDSNKIEYLANYKVTNLIEDKNVYFTYVNEYFYKSDIYNINSPFIICQNKNEACINNITFYTFLKGKDYTIYINLMEKNPKFEYTSF